MKGGNTLNSKTEYNRCRIPRLTIDHEVWQIMKKKGKEILEDEARRMEEEMQPSGMGELQYEIGPEKKEMKRKDKPAESKNCKRLKLVPLEGWGEH